jgi:methyltransferase OMS1
VIKEQEKRRQQLDITQADQSVVLPKPVTEVKPAAKEVKMRTFDDLAPEYDRAIGFDEFVMGLNVIRRSLMRHAHGRVLEVSVGTGRNIPYYPSTKHVQSVTFVDQSVPMLEQAVKKFDSYADSKFTEYQPWYQRFMHMILYGKTRPIPEIPSEFIHSDGTKLEFAQDSSYDTVVDTFGLCSVGDRSVELLNEMARVCKPDGKVLLLEHGRSSYQWLNNQLDKHAEEHHHKWACWWNRDIEALIAKSNLEIESYWRWHFGTTYYIVARPRKPI